MNAHLRKRKNSPYWYVVIYEDKGGRGDRKARHRWRSTGLTHEAEAEKLRIQWLAEALKRRPKTTASMTVGQYLQGWVDERATEVRESTARFYRDRLRHTRDLWKIRLESLEPEHIRRLLDRLRKDTRMGRTSLHGVFTALRAALKDAVHRDLLWRNPCDAVRAPGVDRPEMATVPLGRIPEILERSEAPYRTIFKLMLFTGLRRGEALGLRRQDLNLEAGTLVVLQQLASNGQLEPPKTKGSRATVVLGPEIVAALAEYLQADDAWVAEARVGARTRSDLVFHHLDGRALAPGSVTQYWRRLMRRLGITNVRLHDTRHTHATVLLAEGMDIRSVAARMRHSSAAFTASVYGHLLPGRHQEMAERFEARIRRESANGSANG